MWVDLIALFVLVFFCAAGYFRGFVSLLFTFLGLVATYIGTPHLARWIESSTDWSALDPQSRYWVVLAGAAAILYFGFNFVGLVVSHFVVGKEEHHKRRDRIMGLGLGLLQGGVIALFLACLVGAAPKTMRESSRWLDSQVQGSQLVDAVGPWNPILQRRKELEWIGELGDAIAMLSDPDMIEDIELSESAKKALENGAIKKVLTDNKLIEALRRQDYTELFSKENWRAILENRELREAVDKIDLETIRTEIEDARAERGARVEEIIEKGE